MVAIVGRLDDRERLRLGIGVDQQREAGIGAADIADQDREGAGCCRYRCLGMACSVLDRATAVGRIGG